MCCFRTRIIQELCKSCKTTDSAACKKVSAACNGVQQSDSASTLFSMGKLNFNDNLQTFNRL